MSVSILNLNSLVIKSKSPVLSPFSAVLVLNLSTSAPVPGLSSPVLVLSPSTPAPVLKS